MRRKGVFLSIILVVLSLGLLAEPESARAENYIFTALTKHFLTNTYPGEKILVKIEIYTRHNIDSRIEKKDLWKDWELHNHFISAFLEKGWEEGDPWAMAQDGGFIEITREKRMNLRGKKKDKIIAYLYVCEESTLWNQEIYRGKGNFSQYTRGIVGKVEDCLKYDQYLR